MDIKFLRLAAFALLLPGCQASGTWKDESIDPKIRAEIRTLDNLVMEGFANGSADKILPICSQGFILKGNTDLAGMVEGLRRRIDPAKFKIQNQFYWRNTKTTEQAEVMTGISGEHDYTLRFPASGAEMFVTVGYFESTLESLALTTIYTRENGVWRLDRIQTGMMKLAGNDAVDWYLQSKANFKKGYIVDAVSCLTLCTRCMKPANQYWQYRLEEGVNQLRGPVQRAIDSIYTFPIVVAAVPSKPEIFKLFPQGMDDTYYPAIYYNTKVSMRDTSALSRECDEVHRHAGELFKGLTKNNRRIIYRAFENVPAGDEVVKSYGFIRETEQ